MPPPEPTNPVLRAPLKRRHVLGGGLALAGAAALGVAPARAAIRRAKPGGPGWPGDADWAELGRAVGGRLAPVTLPKLDTPEAKALLANPFYIGDQVGLTESSGWLDAWRSQPSAYAVAAESAADVAAAVRFAAAHNLRLVVKGRGHSYLGASNAPDSLLIWTRRMDQVTVHDAFTPQGSNAAPVPAVSAGGGAMWLHAYQAVTNGAGRYVQGGGCTTVGVAGLVQGGGFGSFSKGFGMAAASLLEAEIVTADGQVRVVNRTQESDLFWALKGGGGGTFGVLTRLTLATHDLPENFGAARMTLHAKSDDAYRRLLARFVDFYATSLFNPHWGEQVTAGPDNRLEISMVFQGLTTDQARAAWKPLLDFVGAHPDDYEGQGSFLALALPARRFWDAEYMRHLPGVIVSDPRPGAAAGDFWWTGNTGEAGTFWGAYTSAWLPADLLKPRNQARLVDAWFNASRHWSVAFHLNKGLAGAPSEALAAARDTATNPEVVDAFALAIIASDGKTLFGGAEPNLQGARFIAARVQASMKALRVAAPNAGAYVNECDYFQADWQRAFWGPNYPRLARIKRRYDPTGLFTVHHGVGSEGWSADGFERV
ncbi:MAG TPA: FAD-binding protein [Caulobacteraceae bacterium]|jgi:FAD/FMN-containing dehydrogenase|nr:FAD-binding protein [Caulobacteraceae bacterium]